MLTTVPVILISSYTAFCVAQEPKLPRQQSQFQSGSLQSFSRKPERPQVAEAQQGNYQRPPSSSSLYQPWQNVPAAYDPTQRCEVEESSRLECGSHGISPADCEALNCCYDNRRFIQAYDGPMCYYGKAVTVQCTKDGQFVLVVARDATRPTIALDNISMLAAAGPCTAVDSNTNFAIYQFPVTTCGTKVKVEGDYVIYENIMTSSYEVGIGPRGSITRDSVFELTFQCRYLATAVESLAMDVNTAPPPLPVVEEGPLRVELRLANGVCTTKGCSDVDIYSSYYTAADYPVTKVLRDPVYVEVRMLERSDPNIALVLNHCWATSGSNPSSMPQWDLIVDGCPYQDDRYLTTVIPVSPASGLQNPSHYKRFVVKMFTFVDDNSLLPQQQQVFIHCTSAVCQLSVTENCEPSCGRNRKTRRSLSGQDSGKKTLVSSGEVLIVADFPVSAKSQAESNGEGSQVFGYVLNGVAALAVLAICGVVVAVFQRRTKPHLCPETITNKVT